MDMGLQSRVVVVTGGGRGIGRVIADVFRGEGATVISLDVRIPEPTPSGEIHLYCDVTSRSSVQEAISSIVRTYDRIDVLVNNAGIVSDAPAESIELSEWKRVFEVNVEGVLNTCQAVIPVMKQRRWGRIVNAASFAAIIPSVGASAYAASKVAVAQLSRTLGSELGAWGITVNAYAPGMVPTAMNGFADLPQADQAVKLDQLSIRRWGTPEEVAHAVCFLASDRAGYIPGTLLDVSGGKFATQVPAAAYQPPYV